MISRRSLFWLLLILVPFVFAACSEASGSLGQIYEGRILMLTVLEIDNTEELQYSTIDPSDVIREWRVQPSKDDLELLLMRLKVENHIAVNAIFVADQQAAVVRDFFDEEYRPLSVTNTVYLDKRGRSDVSVSFEGGTCPDNPRLVVSAGTNVEWTNGGEVDSVIQFESENLPQLGADPIVIAPGGSVSHRFDQPGTFDYQCSGGEGPTQPAQVLVEGSDSVRGKLDNNILFLDGTFELPSGTGVDGWMVFEVPVGTKLRDLRWRAGDSITIRF